MQTDVGDGQPVGVGEVDVAFASRVKGVGYSVSAANPAGTTLRATAWGRWCARALYTLPVPSAPTAESTSYGPGRAPLERGMRRPRAL